MNFYFKIKHYLAPYFLILPSYKFNPIAIPFNKNYWIKGYSNNIIKNKWLIEDGIPLGLYTSKLNLTKEKRVHIAGLCEYCFANIEMGFSEKNKPVKDFIFKYISHEFSDRLKFKYSFWKTYTEPKKNIYYVHGMGQGQILSLFSRQWIIEKEKNVMDLLISVSNSYLINFNHKNGFVNTKAGVFFEEYPKNQETDSKVFNGWMLSIIGLYDYLNVADENQDQFLEKKRDLYNKSVNTLIKNLNNYNLYYWTTYCQPRSILNICSMHYQIQHISFLDTLYHLTKKNEFKYFKNKLLFQFYNPLFRILSLISKILISNIFKYGRLYKSK